MTPDEINRAIYDAVRDEHFNCERWSFSVSESEFAAADEYVNNVATYGGHSSTFPLVDIYFFGVRLIKDGRFQNEPDSYAASG